MTPFTVRKAQAADAVALAHLRWRFKQEDEPGPRGEEEPFIRECTEWMRVRLAGPWTAWVAEADNEVHGHVFLNHVEKVPEPGTTADTLGYVTNFYVCPEYRGRGLGKALLEEVVRHGQQNRLDTLIVWPSERSASLYRRVGFTAPEETLELPIEPL
ncbi:GNAT family N-acetyltransferase [Streptomyces alboflavus]|uniref:GNAT family N-acetyltransferase n=1 Tax=Streptomyces alboflavus TaxID=67267 RepID=UPI000F658E64|nr:GNAT family N-acetyltransferase [Streptomyces alboflavus]